MTRIETLPDDSLVEGFRAEGGDRHFAELFRRYRGAVYGRCRRMLRDAAVAEELTQQVFMTAFRKLDLFAGGDFGAWLHVIARNTCLNYLRTQTSRNQPLALDENRAADATEQDPLLAQRILATLEHLSAPQRVVLKLFYVHGYTYKEVAAVTGFDERAVKSHVQNGRKRFRALWERSGRDRGGRA